jgi:hypothetical protein
LSGCSQRKTRALYPLGGRAGGSKDQGGGGGREGAGSERERGGERGRAGESTWDSVPRQATVMNASIVPRWLCVQKNETGAKRERGGERERGGGSGGFGGGSHLEISECRLSGAVCACASISAFGCGERGLGRGVWGGVCVERGVGRYHQLMCVGSVGRCGARGMAGCGCGEEGKPKITAHTCTAKYPPPIWQSSADALVLIPSQSSIISVCTKRKTQTQTHTLTHARTHTHTHKYVHTHAHIHTHMDSLSCQGR